MASTQVASMLPQSSWDDGASQQPRFGHPRQQQQQQQQQQPVGGGGRNHSGGNAPTNPYADDVETAKNFLLHFRDHAAAPAPSSQQRAEEAGGGGRTRHQPDHHRRRRRRSRASGGQRPRHNDDDDGDGDSADPFADSDHSEDEEEGGGAVAASDPTPGSSGIGSNDDRGPLSYLLQLQHIANRESNTLTIDLDDLYVASEEELARKCVHNGKRYMEIFAQAADAVLSTLSPTVRCASDTLDILMEQREQREAENREAEQTLFGTSALAPDAAVDPQNRIPDSLRRRYQVLLLPPSADKSFRLRDVRAGHVGQLTKVSGIVTRVLDVKPMVQVAVYICDTCGVEWYQEVPGRHYMPLTLCPGSECQRNAAGGGRLMPQYRAFKYCKYQELKIQEPTQDVPVGSIPRTMTVHLHGALTRTCTAGDRVAISGVFLPVLLSGFRALKAGLLSDTFLEATHVQQLKRDYKDYQLTAETEARIAGLASDPRLYDRLAQSVAPEIYGHENVKKALLLLLVGAPPRQLKDGMRLRGDLHLCLMGDPGVAKSQLLRYICNVAPRGVYTTGKGSSGVGLTAAVMRDPSTGDMMLEGGALVMADHGIACIDEFDKMDDSDRTAIHEVMEQQTVSIAKAGITTTLNARAAVLAAANPAYGRYNRKRTPAENINMPAALLSRFDLMFLLLDQPDGELDLALARHITHVHRTGEHPSLGFEPITAETMRAYIAEARRVSPTVPRQMTPYIVDNYVAMRSEEVASGTDARSYTTARTLLSVLRLSQALARLRLAAVVTHDDVDEAVRLMNSSKESLEDSGGFGGGGGGRSGEVDPTTRVYLLIRDYAANRGVSVVPIADVIGRVLQSGFTEREFRQALEEYQDLGVFGIDPDWTRISFTV